MGLWGITVCLASSSPEWDDTLHVQILVVEPHAGDWEMTKTCTSCRRQFVAPIFSRGNVCDACKREAQKRAEDPAPSTQTFDVYSPPETYHPLDSVITDTASLLDSMSGDSSSSYDSPSYDSPSSPDPSPDFGGGGGFSGGGSSDSF